MKIAAIVHCSSLEKDFINICLKELNKICDQIIVPVADNFYDKSIENYKLIEKIIKENDFAKFIRYKLDLTSNKPTWHWENFSRYIGFLELNENIELVLFIDADTILDFEKFIEWLKIERVEYFDKIVFPAYFYFRSPIFQAKQFITSSLMIKRKLLNRNILLPEEYRDFIETPFDDKNLKILEALGNDGLPMFHNFSFVRTKENLIKKMEITFGEVEQEKQSMIQEEFSHDFNGNEGFFNFDYIKVHPKFNFDITEDKQILLNNSNKKSKAWKKNANDFSFYSKKNNSDDEVNKLISQFYSNYESFSFNELQGIVEKICVFEQKIPQLFNMVGMKAFKEQKNSSADEFFKKAISIDPNFKDAYFNLGILSISEKRFSLAIKNFLQLKKLSPKESSIGQYISTIYSDIFLLGQKLNNSEEFSLSTIIVITNENESQIDQCINNLLSISQKIILINKNAQLNDFVKDKYFNDEKIIFVNEESLNTQNTFSEDYFYLAIRNWKKYYSNNEGISLFLLGHELVKKNQLSAIINKLRNNFTSNRVDFLQEIKSTNSSPILVNNHFLNFLFDCGLEDVIDETCSRNFLIY